MPPSFSPPVTPVHILCPCLPQRYVLVNVPKSHVSPLPDLEAYAAHRMNSTWNSVPVMGWLFFLLNFYSTIHTLCTVAYLSDSPDLKPALTQVEREKSALYLVILDHSASLCSIISGNWDCGLWNTEDYEAHHCSHHAEHSAVSRTQKGFQLSIGCSIYTHSWLPNDFHSFSFGAEKRKTTKI